MLRRPMTLSRGPDLLFRPHRLAPLPCYLGFLLGEGAASTQATPEMLTVSFSLKCFSDSVTCWLAARRGQDSRVLSTAASHFT